jgi:hypothetical protein
MKTNCNALMVPYEEPEKETTIEFVADDPAKKGNKKLSPEAEIMLAGIAHIVVTFVFNKR